MAGAVDMAGGRARLRPPASPSGQAEANSAAEPDHTRCYGYLSHYAWHTMREPDLPR